MFKVIMLFSIIIVQLFSNSLLHAASLKISCSLREIELDRFVERAKLVVNAGDEARDLNEKPGRYEFAGDIGAQVDKLVFTIDPPKPFNTREIRLRVNRYSKTINANPKIYVLDESTEVTHKFLNSGFCHFGRGEYEKALAHYDFAFRKKGAYQDIDDFYIKLNTYYARALHNVCTNLSYDTCSQAIKLAKDLLELYDRHTSKFQRLGISRNNLEEIAKESTEAENIMLYSEMQTLFRQGEYVAAAELTAGMIEDASKDPKAFYAIGLSPDRLAVDAGVSYLKASDKAEKEGSVSREQMVNYLNSAKEHLSKVKPDEKNRVRENLAIIQEKLKK
jgi:tetratricopeptide (TPR) repeat protein